MGVCQICFTALGSLMGYDILKLVKFLFEYSIYLSLISFCFQIYFSSYAPHFNEQHHYSQAVNLTLLFNLTLPKCIFNYPLSKADFIFQTQALLPHLNCYLDLASSCFHLMRLSYFYLLLLFF